MLLVLSVVFCPAASHAQVPRDAPAAPTSPTIGAPFTLQTPQRQPLTDKSFRGRWLIVFFGYTSCPDVCPTTLSTLTETFDQLGAEGDGVRGLFITLDPRRDTPDVLARYMQNFSPHITAATGSDAQIAAAVKAFRVRYEIEGDVAGGRYTINHPVALMLFNPHGRFVTLIPGGATARDVIRTLRGNMLAGQSTPNLCFTNQLDQRLCLSQWQGRAVLLNLWATWCVPCRKEMPQLDRLQARFGGPAFEVVALSVDRGGTPVVMNYYHRDNLRHLAVYQDAELRANEIMFARGIPVSFLIDRNGRIVERIRGSIDWESPERIASIRQLIGPSAQQAVNQ